MSMQIHNNERKQVAGFLPIPLFLFFFLMPTFTPMAMITGIILTLWALFRFKSLRWEPRPLCLHIYLAWGYFLWLVIATSIAGWSNEAILGLSPHIQFLYLPVFFIAVANSGFSLPAQKLAFYSFSISAAFLGLLLLEAALVKESYAYAPFGTEGNRRYWKIGFEYPRHSLLAGNPLTMADIMFPILFASFAGYWRQSKHLQFAIPIVVIGTSAAIIIFTQNRSSLLITIVLLAISAIYLISSARPHIRAHLLIALGILMAFGMLFSLRFDFSPVLSRWQGVDADITNFLNGQFDQISKSMRIRFDYWLASVTVIQSNPILGYGPGNIMSELYPHLQTEIAKQRTSYHLTPHNWVFNQLLAGGGIGLAILSAFLLTPFYRAIRLPSSSDRGDWSFLGLVYFGSLMISGLTNNLFFDDGKSTAFISMALLLSLLISHASETNDLAATEQV